MAAYLAFFCANWMVFSEAPSAFCRNSRFPLSSMMQMVTCTLRFAASLSAAATMVLMAARFRYFRVGSSAADATNPFSALFEGDAYAISWLRASSASFCHYNRRPDRIGSAPPEVSTPDGPSEHAVGAAQHSASAGPTLLRVGEC